MAGKAAEPGKEHDMDTLSSSAIGVDTALAEIKRTLGAKGWIEDPHEQEPYLVEARGLYRGRARLVVLPAATEEVAAVVRICARARLPIVPQGGNTGLVSGALPAADGNNIVLALARMNRIRALDPVNFTITVEAGCILAEVQRAAAAADRLFPLSLGAEGSCQIGGNLSTNVGGIAVLRYGNARELTLGLEVVLPDGRVWDGLRGLRKDNTGYDLKQLFIGGEGTLGIITAATLKLFPRPREVETAFVALSRVEDAMGLFERARAMTADQLTAFELIPRDGLDLALAHIPGTIDPLAERHPRIIGAAARGGARRGPRRRRRHRCERRAAKRPVADPRGDCRSAEILGLDQARRVGAGQPRRRIHHPRQRRGQRAPARHSPDRLRPCRRRQYPFQLDPTRGRRQRGLSRALAGIQRHRPRHRARS